MAFETRHPFRSIRSLALDRKRIGGLHANIQTSERQVGRLWLADLVKKIMW